MADKRETWKQIIEIEPRLKELHGQAKRISSAQSGRFCANQVWYDFFKERLTELVGWEANNAAIKTIRHYDVAYEKIYNALPDCRGCSCL